MGNDGYKNRSKRTKYNGTTFKSSLEAHWASFFNHEDIEWKYEPHQVQIDAFRFYTPDFTLHCISPPAFVEIKPTWEMVTEDDRLMRLSTVVSNVCLGACGDPGLWPEPSPFKFDHMKGASTHIRPPSAHSVYYLEDGEVCAVWGMSAKLPRSRYTFPDWVSMLQRTKSGGG